jgi:HlyD family secretion protein
MKWAKRAILALVVLGVIALVAYGFMPKPVAVETANVVQGTILVTIDEEARTRVTDRYTLYAPLAGDLERISLKVGDNISAGDAITRLVPLPPQPLDARTRAEARARVASAEARVEGAQADIDAAETQHRFARDEFERARRLQAGSHVSQDAVDAARTRKEAADAMLRSARFRYKAAQHDVEMARAALMSADDAGDEDLPAIALRAPVSGRVLSVFRDSAGAVTPGEPLLEIGDPARLEVVADLLSRDAVRTRAGMKVRLERWGGETIQGTVRHVEPSGFTKISALGVEEQRVNVIIDIDDPHGRWEALGDRFRVEARIIVQERHNTRIVPAGAVFNTAEGPAVFVATGGQAVLRHIRTGVRSGAQVEALEGLEEGDRVVVHPTDEVKDGVAITGR